IRGDGITVTAGSSLSMTPTTSELVNIDTGNTGNNLNVNVPLVFGANEGILYTANTGGSTGALTINSATTGTAGLTIGGPGTLNLAGASTYTGNTTLTAGTLVLGSSSVVTSAVISSGPIGLGTLVA